MANRPSSSRYSPYARPPNRTAHPRIRSSVSITNSQSNNAFTTYGNGQNNEMPVPARFSSNYFAQRTITPRTMMPNASMPIGYLLPVTAYPVSSSSSYNNSLSSALPVYAAPSSCPSNPTGLSSYGQQNFVPAVNSMGRYPTTSMPQFQLSSSMFQGRNNSNVSAARPNTMNANMPPVQFPRIIVPSSDVEDGNDDNENNQNDLNTECIPGTPLRTANHDAFDMLYQIRNNTAGVSSAAPTAAVAPASSDAIGRGVDVANVQTTTAGSVDPPATRSSTVPTLASATTTSRGGRSSRCCSRLCRLRFRFLSQL